MDLLDNAIQIAARAHAGQTRRNGTPYVLHPIRVMLRQQDPEAMIAGVLHDVVEDTDVTLEDLQREGFSEGVLAAIRLLTHEDDVPYADYVRAIADDPIAHAVKLADLEDNMNVRELPSVTDRDLTRMAKYHKAWQTLSKPE